MRSRAIKFLTSLVKLFFYFPSLFYYYFHFVRKDIIVDYDFLINAQLRLVLRRSLIQRDF